MGKNAKILYCILGSTILTLLNSSILMNSALAIYEGGYGTSIFGKLLVRLTKILSLAGFILLIAFSIILIIRNINLKDK